MFYLKTCNAWLDKLTIEAIKDIMFRVRRNCAIASFVDIPMKRFWSKNPQIQTNCSCFFSLQKKLKIEARLN